MVIEAAALWLFSTRNPSVLRDDDQLTYLIGTAVLHLAPRTSRGVWVNGKREKRYGRLAGRVRHAFGKLLRNELGILFLRIADTIQRQQEVEYDRRQTLGAPFVT